MVATSERYFVFTHGQLDPFFKLNLIKKIKKQIYWYLIEKKRELGNEHLIKTTIEIEQTDEL